MAMETTNLGDVEFEKVSIFKTWGVIEGKGTIICIMGSLVFTYDHPASDTKR